jgi:hypothetical protein
MSSLPVVAIAGATGRAGTSITKAFLSPKFRPNFSEVVLLSRSHSSPQLDAWAKEGATIRPYTQDALAEALHGVNIVINCVGSKGHALKDALLPAIAATPSVSLYFPSELGVDHGDGTDPDYDHPEWAYKKNHLKMAKESFDPKVKICRVFPGLMTELSIGPWFGMDTRNKRYEAVGSVDAPITFTYLDDIGRAVAALASLPPEKIPSEIRIGGDTLSTREIAELMSAESGRDIEVVEMNLEDYKKEAIGKQRKDPGQYLRFLMGEGKINFGKDGLGNGNDLFNAGEREWKWMSMKDYAKQTKGFPWPDYEAKG